MRACRSAPSRIAPRRRRRCRRTSKSSPAISPCPSRSTPGCEASAPSSSSGPHRRRLLRRLSSASQPTRGGSSFSPHRTRPRTRSSSKPNPMAVLHADIERLIAATGLESTIIRPGMLASNALFWWAAAIRADGVVRWPYGAAETAPVDDRDVAAVVARTLYRDGHAGGDYVLTGPESLSQADQVRIIGDVLRRRITFEELSPDEFRSRDRRKLAAPGRGHAARRVGRNDGKAGVHHLYGVRHPRIGAAIVSPVGRRSRRRVLGRSNPGELTGAAVRQAQAYRADSLFPAFLACTVLIPPGALTMEA